MSTQRKSQISHLNDASEKIVKSHECLEQEVEKLSTDDQNIKEIQSKVASVLEACANQQQVSREVYMEQNKETGKKRFQSTSFYNWKNIQMLNLQRRIWD